MIGRFPILDIAPRVEFGGEFVGVKAIPHESIEVSATIIREGHDSLSAQVILYGPAGAEVSRTPMVEKWKGSDRFSAVITPDSIGHWHFAIEAFDEQDPARNRDATRLSCISEKYPIHVEGERALVGAWYEFFPRSEGAIKNADGSVTSGTFTTAIARLQRVADMKFDILYIPPIHPIGLAFRKGKNNSLDALPSDPGVPWGIGGAAGGHDAVNPELGTLKDFDTFVSAAKKLNIDVALDLALQTSPDHPWVKSNPEWFTTRPDGTIAYAENPPKKYQDIYPINFDNDYAGILAEVKRVVEFWIARGINFFRVDNPHTKPVHFWQELIGLINAKHPQVVFLAEAFTRPPMMHALGKAGFQQSYTYFTWRVTKKELTDYGNEVAHQTSAFFRPNFWVNTPDILPTHLQTGAPAIFALRAVLASTLTPSWGMYAGYELYEHERFKEGGEEYLDSEKYEIKVRDWESASKNGRTLAPFIAQLNEIRRNHLALQRLRNLSFHSCENDQILAYSKREGNDLILVVVNLDPARAQETTIRWDFEALGIPEKDFAVTDLLDGSRYTWSSETYVRLDPIGKVSPLGSVAHIAHVKL